MRPGGGIGATARLGEGAGSSGRVALRAKIAELKAQREAWRTWRFKDTEAQWRHDVLAALVEGLRAFARPRTGTIAGVEARLAFARSIEKRSIEDHRAEWEEAIASIANRDECPMYGGLTIAPQIGLVPIGRDPDSGLWEFAHLQTGTMPRRDASGKLVLAEDMGLVFVLIPGGDVLDGGPEGRPQSPQLRPDGRQ